VLTLPVVELDDAGGLESAVARAAWPVFDLAADLLVNATLITAPGADAGVSGAPAGDRTWCW